MEFKPEKKLGFGLMRLPLHDPKDEGSIDIERSKEMVDAFIEKGFTYFDTAWMYHDFKSEDATKEILVDRHPRESYSLATKLHALFIKSKEDRDKVFETQLQKTGAGYFDYYLLHGMTEKYLKTYNELDCFTWLAEKKAQGLVKHMGFSFHDTPELLDRILTEHPEMEFVQLQLNYLDWESPWIRARECYEVATKHHTPVVVMEPVKGGTLAKLPEEAEALFRQADATCSIPSWAVRFVASLPNVMVVLSGMSSPEQLEDNCGYMAEFKPLTEEEKSLCFKAAEIVNAQTAVPCTGCHYCTAGCPMDIPIPDYFSIYNEDMREDLEEKGWSATMNNYNDLKREHGKPEDCIACGQCEGVCPQHLPIIEDLKTLAEFYSKL